MHLVQELENNGLHKDSVIYGTLISICASNNLSEEAEAFFQQMLDEGCCPNIFHYSSLLNAYSLDGNYTKAEKLVESMKSSGVAPNKVSFISTYICRFLYGVIYIVACTLFLFLTKCFPLECAVTKGAHTHTQVSLSIWFQLCRLSIRHICFFLTNYNFCFGR